MVTGWTMWPWPLTSLMTFTMDFSRSNFKIAVSQEKLVWLLWNEKEVNWFDTRPIVWPYPLTTPMTLTLKFQVQSYLWNWRADWHGTKGMWVVHSWPWHWPYMVVWVDVPDSNRGDFRRHRHHFQIHFFYRILMRIDPWCHMVSQYVDQLSIIDSLASFKL